MKCANCNTPIDGKMKRRYCSSFCHREFWDKARKITQSEKDCKVCGSKFMPKSKLNICCSIKCKRKRDTELRTDKPKIKNCKVCSKEYTPYTSLSSFCSYECRHENMKSKRSRRWSQEAIDKRKGKNNPSYTHGMSINGKTSMTHEGMRKFRKNCKEMDDEMINEYGYIFCEWCRQTTSRIEHHHIIFRSEKPKHPNLHDKENIITLCVPCHNKFHSKKGTRNELVEKRGLNKIFGNDVLNK